MKTRNEEDEGLNALEMLGAVALVGGTAVVLTMVLAPKAAAVAGGGLLAALGAKLLLLGLASSGSAT